MSGPLESAASVSLSETQSRQLLADVARAQAARVLELRRGAIREAFIHAWSAYQRSAWGHDELMPLSKEPTNWMNLGLTIVDSLDTMIIFGLQEQYDAARAWIEGELKFDNNKDVSVFETNIRVLGGLLSAYDLTQDRLYLNKATELADRLLYAFNTTYGIPMSTINLATLAISCPSWTGRNAILSEYGSMFMEFKHLSHLTKNPVYAEKVDQLILFMEKSRPDDGLFPLMIDPSSGRFTNTAIKFGGLGDSFYEYLLKTWVLIGRPVSASDSDASDSASNSDSKANASLDSASTSDRHSSSNSAPDSSRISALNSALDSASDASAPASAAKSTASKPDLDEAYKRSARVPGSSSALDPASISAPESDSASKSSESKPDADGAYKRLYDAAIGGMHEKLIHEVQNMTLIAEIDNGGRRIMMMEELACFVPGMLALGVKLGGSIRPKLDQEVAEALGQTCFNMWATQPSGLAPESVHFVEGSDLIGPIQAAQKYYILRPETIESLFVLWRSTHDPKYRDMGWTLFQSIQAACRTQEGYTGVRDVTIPKPEQENLQHSFFLAETLKYAFLLFSDDDVIPLDQYVFNTEAHPFRIWK